VCRWRVGHSRQPLTSCATHTTDRWATPVSSSFFAGRSQQMSRTSRAPPTDSAPPPKIRIGPFDLAQLIRARCWPRAPLPLGHQRLGPTCRVPPDRHLRIGASTDNLVTNSVRQGNLAWSLRAEFASSRLYNRATYSSSSSRGIATRATIYGRRAPPPLYLDLDVNSRQ
jgi:hypothetical protein